MHERSRLTTIARRLREALRRDRRVSAEPLDISVRDDRVVLRGRVRSHRRKLAAIRIAEETAPRLSVDDRIHVDATGPSDDRVVARAVCDRLRHHDAVTHETINVGVRNGRVRLSGLVATPSERLGAENVAMAAPGVRSVRNLLVVDAAGQRRDVERSRELQRCLHESLGPAADAIQVLVAGPRVILRGEVPGGWYRERAGEIARLDGAHRVRNRLQVRGES